MTFSGVIILALCVGAIALSRRVPSLWLAGALGRTAIVTLMAVCVAVLERRVRAVDVVA